MKTFKIFIWLRDAWIYFKTGHSTYFVYAISIFNFITIQYALIVSHLSWAAGLFDHILKFATVFGLAYVPVAIIVGYFEFRKGETRRRPQLNPYIQDSVKADLLLYEGLLQHVENPEARQRLEQAIEIKRRWIK